MSDREQCRRGGTHAHIGHAGGRCIKCGEGGFVSGTDERVTTIEAGLWCAGPPGDHLYRAAGALASLAADAAETERLRNRLRDAPLGGDGSHWDGCELVHIDCARARIESLETERDEMSKQLDWHIDKVRSLLNVEADRDRLAEAAHDLNEYASNKAGYWQHPLTEKARAHFAALAGREGSDDA